MLSGVVGGGFVAGDRGGVFMVVRNSVAAYTDYCIVVTGNGDVDN